MAIIVDPAATSGASVSLRGVFLNLVADPANFRVFRDNPSLSPTVEARGEFRQLANGRTRLIRQAGRMRAYELGFTAWRDDLRWLEDHVGDLMCLRDDRGRKMFGAYLAVSSDEPYWTTDRGDVSFTFSTVSYSEAV